MLQGMSLVDHSPADLALISFTSGEDFFYIIKEVFHGSYFTIKTTLRVVQALSCQGQNTAAIIVLPTCFLNKVWLSLTPPYFWINSASSLLGATPAGFATGPKSSVKSLNHWSVSLVNKTTS